MKRYWLRGLLLIAFALTSGGCASPDRPRPRTNWAPLQTGSNISRRIDVNESGETAARPQNRVRKSKPAREKPDGERRRAPAVEDPDSVPRGGFR